MAELSRNLTSSSQKKAATTDLKRLRKVLRLFMAMSLATVARLFVARDCAL